MVYTLRMSRLQGLYALIFGVFLLALVLASNRLHVSGAFRATVAGVALFCAILGVLGMLSPPSVLRADTSGLTLYSAILRRRVLFLAWHEIDSIEVVVRWIEQTGKESEGQPEWATLKGFNFSQKFDYPILIIRSTTPGRRARGRVNYSIAFISIASSSFVFSRSAIQDLVYEVDLEDPRSIVWLLPNHAYPPAVVDQINAVRTRAERNKGIQRDSNPKEVDTFG